MSHHTFCPAVKCPESAAPPASTAPLLVMWVNCAPRLGTGRLPGTGPRFFHLWGENLWVSSHFLEEGCSHSCLHPFPKSPVTVSTFPLRKKSRPIFVLVPPVIEVATSSFLPELHFPGTPLIASPAVSPSSSWAAPAPSPFLFFCLTLQLACH